MSSMSSNKSGSSRQEQLNEHYAPVGGQQRGYVFETESEGSGSRHDPGEASSSRSQQQVRVELSQANLARVDQQPLVRGPLKQLDMASEQMTESNHLINQELDRLDKSILEHQETVKFLRERIERFTDAQSPEERAELQQLETQLTNTLQRIEQEEEQQRRLVRQLEQQGQLVDDSLRTRGLAVSRSANQVSYPARVDLAQDTTVVDEGVRPPLHF